MNSEIYSILDDMKKHMPKNPIATSDRHTDLSIKNSMLLVLLAEENEKSAKKLEKLTKTLTVLTWFIAILTTFLVLSVFFIFPKVFVQFNQQPYFTIEKTEKTEKNNPPNNKNELPLQGEIVPHMKIQK
jgi:hypothetical protein